jgi:hypothetical protein
MTPGWRIILAWVAVIFVFVFIISSCSLMTNINNQREEEMTRYCVDHGYSGFNPSYDNGGPGCIGKKN